jgi:hypothetical protein
LLLSNAVFIIVYGKAKFFFFLNLLPPQKFDEKIKLQNETMLIFLFSKNI